MNASAGHVFVSHSSDNRELAGELAAFLEGRGIRVWIAPRDVRPGMDYSEELQRAIEQCGAFVVLVTEKANKSPYVRAETEMAFSTHKPIFPVRTTEIQPAPGLAFFLKIRHWTDAFGTYRSDNLDRLVRELQATSGASAGASAAPVPPPAPPPPPAPGPGPQPARPAAAAAPIGTAPLPPLPGDPEEEERWRAAIGPNADFYLGRWRAMETRGTAINWNWPACLVSVFWFAYRKMWLPMAGVILASFLFGLIGAAGGGAGRVSLFLSIALSFATGAFGNHLYRRQTARLIADTAPLGRPAQIEALRSRGGVSVPAMAVLLVFFLLVVLLSMVGAMRAQIGNGMEPANGFGTQSGTTDPYGVSGSVDGSQGQEPVPDKPPIDESELPPDDYSGY